jgi:hypothetical protein
VRNIDDNSPKTGKISYVRNPDDTFVLVIDTPSGNLDGDGSLKRDDTKINLSAAGFSMTFEQQKKDDGTWAGKLQLPVGLLRWNGNSKDAILSDLHIK